MTTDKNTYDALALFSGGLDSILAARTVMDQGLSVLGLHFTTPFFGKAHLIPFWREHYGVEVIAVDVSQPYVDMILDGPETGFGKQLNPCVDCKVLMLAHARKMMDRFGAKFLVSGEVVGQRPMSQRPDALNLIRKRAEVADVLLRPLCAKKIDPTPMELSGLVDRERLLDFYGRNRKPQLELAERYGFTEIPTPAGGCVLTEIEGSTRFWRLITAHEAIGSRPAPEDFLISQTGRQLWAGGDDAPLWLAIGRNKADNDRLLELRRKGDLTFKTADHPGPIALARPVASSAWTTDAKRDAAALVASYSPKAVRSVPEGDEVRVSIDISGERTILSVVPARESALGFAEPGREGFREWKSAKLKG